MSALPNSSHHWDILRLRSPKVSDSSHAKRECELGLDSTWPKHRHLTLIQRYLTPPNTMDYLLEELFGICWEGLWVLKWTKKNVAILYLFWKKDRKAHSLAPRLWIPQWFVIRLHWAIPTYHQSLGIWPLPMTWITCWDLGGGGVWWFKGICQHKDKTIWFSCPRTGMSLVKNCFISCNLLFQWRYMNLLIENGEWMRYNFALSFATCFFKQSKWTYACWKYWLIIIIYHNGEGLLYSIHTNL